jgi:UDP-N-acetylglucosamine transferase subunit ALG13
METTYHAEKRMQQRGFNEAIVEIIMHYGRQEYLPGGAIGLFFGDKECRKFQKLIEKAKNAKVITKNGQILTCYKNQRAAC